MSDRQGAALARATKRPVGMLARGNPGAAAAAAFRGDRVAPPMFGNLADGLRRTNPADAKAAPMPSAALSAPAGPRRPRVTGVLGGGAGVIDRGVHTSIANKKLKRRPAPTVDSVRSRLTRELPVRLTRMARPGTAADGTLLSTGVVPFTAAPGTSRSVAVGRTSSGNALDDLVKGLGVVARKPSASTAPKMLHAGDVGGAARSGRQH